VRAGSKIPRGYARGKKPTRAEDFYAFTRRTPFVPFRFQTTDGRVYDIAHPEQVVPLYSKVIVLVGDRDGVPDHDEHISIHHVLRLKEATMRSRDDAG